MADQVAGMFGGSREALMLYLVQRHDIFRNKFRELETTIEEGE